FDRQIHQRGKEFLLARGNGVIHRFQRTALAVKARFLAKTYHPIFAPLRGPYVKNAAISRKDWRQRRAHGRLLEGTRTHYVSGLGFAQRGYPQPARKRRRSAAQIAEG